ncbi:HAD-IA family hydrolase [Methylocaldum sp.]|uniref:HAD-IA family hydrolase n=1 Tax=Methylocaldum sp. TaxID=1969727 RepID=UPI002D6D1FD8|nr:HAD-IA family hydrolase [Methylocaldum sp.]HYE34553.1 HAD-IA family hydrolase [Methylocaldum sp.]
MNNRFDLLVFDWDGTLFDSVGWIVECLQLAAHDCGLSMPSNHAAKSVIGLGLKEAMETLFPEYPSEMAFRLAESYRRYYGRKTIGADGLFRGVFDMLAELRDQGYRLAVATGKTRSGLDHALAATGTGLFFHATRCADETASKPNPEMLFQLMRELDITEERTLMVGDSLHDLRMAHNAGVAAVGVGCGANDLVELAGFDSLACLDRTADLLKVLNRQTDLI